MPQALAQPMHTDPSVIPWGLLEYSGALERQLEVWATRVRGECRDILAVVEHPPVITLGRHAPAADALLDHPALRDKRIPVVRTDRGGRATYHGPGQAVVYPIVGIAERGLGVKEWVRVLESALLETLGSFGIEGRTIEGRPGVWVGDSKIASLGLRVARGVSYHGVSVNVERRSLEGFAHIVTCGVAGQPVTSVVDQVQVPGRDGEDSQAATVQTTAARFCGALIRRLAVREQS